MSGYFLPLAGFLLIIAGGIPIARSVSGYNRIRSSRDATVVAHWQRRAFQARVAAAACYFLGAMLFLAGSTGRWAVAALAGGSIGLFHLGIMTRMHRRLARRLSVRSTEEITPSVG